jgi:hypothetical protein
MASHTISTDDSGTPYFRRKSGRCISAVYFEAQHRMPILLGQPDIVKHGSDVKKLGIVSQTLSLTGQGTEQIDSSRVVISCCRGF